MADGTAGERSRGGGPRGAAREHAVWSRTDLGGGPPLDLLTARFDQHRYAPHSHCEFTVGVCVGGSEIIDYRGGKLYAGPGSIVVLGPGEPHTGGPAHSTGYAYRAMYPALPLLSEGTRGLPHFREPLLDDPELAAALRTVHTELTAGPVPSAPRDPGPVPDAPPPAVPPGPGPARSGAAPAAGTGAVGSPDPLETECRLPWLLTALARRHGTARPVDDALPGARRIAHAVRDRLADELLAPPSLAELSACLGLSRYQVLRAFRDTMGMPPYAWLAQYRVARARALLDAGHRPAEAAGLVGFADQSHLTRWFRRVLGVTPAAYRAVVRAAAVRGRR
ncbi:AraC family transcriptional regulator [Streptomyces sulfonofaciens]|uniref:AraC family transcriptional regulator n=1 Tax=Streptomyces sulfonofaciens TaxID=68272 RepID=A0A919GHB6_9ACTN|nr:AraC family transcriptional regulator [Streptomyces sulfonofaciens]GHH84544.1 AraC family transcriptional regulator [Streptomyces sulfonofaciens]